MPRFGSWGARWAAAVVVAVCCGMLGWTAVRTWRASADVNAAQDLAQRRGARAALPYLALAVGYRPGRAKAWRLRAQFGAFAHPRAALRYARRAVAVDPADWRNWDQLGLVQFQLGDSAAARRSLAQAAIRDSGWEAHYQLGNLALLLGRRAEFWAQLKAALAVVVAWQAEPLLQEVTAQAGGDAMRLMAILPLGRADVDARAVRLLLRRGRWLTAAMVWRGMQCEAFQRAACRGAALALADGLAAEAFRAQGPAALRSTALSGDGRRPPRAGPRRLVATALQVWNEAVRRQVLSRGLARVGAVGDGDFGRPWVGPAFAWAKDGPVYLSREGGIAPSGGAVRVGFDGYEPQGTGLFFQYVAVRSGAEYEVSYLARREGEGSQTGVALWVKAAPATVILRLPARLGRHWRANRAAFRVPRGTHLIALSFEYHRPMGQVRLRNPVLLARVRLGPIAQ
jgi:hypothetical protein